MRVTCVIKALVCGGAQRNLIRLCDLLSRRGHRVTLLSQRKEEGVDFFPIPDGVERAEIDPVGLADYRWYDLAGTRRRNRAFRESIAATSPEVVISYLDICNVTVLMALAGAGIPVIVSERSDPRFCPIPWRWDWLRRLYYPRATCVVVQTQAVQAWADTLWPKWKTAVIPNAIFPPSPVAASAAAKRTSFQLVNVGRLVKEKRQEHLIVAFAGLANDFPDWKLMIVGEGPQRPQLEAEIRNRGLQDRVSLPGAVENTAEILSQSDLFVFSSLFEGFPNALAEAMACGLPAISYDCPSGPRALIRHGVDGWLVANGVINALRDAMASLMNDENRRKKFGIRAREVVDRFHPDKVMDMWEDVLRRVKSEAGR